MTDFFCEPAHERYGFGSMAVGENLVIDLMGEAAWPVQNHVHSHGRYHGKKFRTKEIDGKLYIKRIQ